MAEEQSLENIQILGKGTRGGIDRIFEKLHLNIQLVGYDSIQAQGFSEKGQYGKDPDKRGLGDQSQVDAVDQIFKQNIDNAFNTKRQP